MPMSWVRLRTASSRKMRECMDGDTSRGKFESCLESIVKHDGGSVHGIWYESSGTVARVHVRWTSLDQRRAIMWDVGSIEDGDLLSGEEVDVLVDERGRS